MAPLNVCCPTGASVNQWRSRRVAMTQEPPQQPLVAEEARRRVEMQQLAAHQQAQQDAAHRQQRQRMPADLPPQLQHLLDTYILGRKLGGGSFGTVRPHGVLSQRL